MQQEPAEELDRMESQFAGHFSRCIVSDREGDLIGVDPKQSLVGDGYPVGVASQVFEDLMRTSERCFGEDDPVGSVESVLESVPICTSQFKCSVLVGLVDCSKEFASEHGGQNLDGQKKFIIALVCIT